MSGLLATSVSGLIAAQRSLETIQHNISNVNTEGYSRQRVELATKPAFLSGEGYLGQGVNITNVTRSYDQFISKQLTISTSAFGDVDRYHQLATRIDNIMADPTTGMAPAMKRFFNSVNELADNSSSIPSRQVMLSEAQVLTQNFNTMNNRFEEIRSQNNNDIDSMVNDINSLAKSIADLNVKIIVDLGQSQGKKQPNDLLDQQDQLISKLAEFVNVSVIKQQNGSSSVFIGSGQSLVLQGGAAEFSTRQSEFDPNHLEVGLKSANGGFMDVTQQITGGSLAGSLRFQNEVLDPAQQQLGRVAVGLALNSNVVHQSGYDLNGVKGQPLFNFAGVEVPVIQSLSNTGNAVVTANFQTTNALAGSTLDYSDFRLEYVAAGGGVDYTLTRIRDNQLINLTATTVGGVSTLSVAATQPPGFNPATFDLSTTISPGTFSTAFSGGTAAVPQEETIGVFSPAVSGGADSFVMDIDGIPFYSKAGSVGATVTKGDLDAALTAFLAIPANAAAYVKVSGSFATDDLRLRKLDGTAIVPNITSNFTATPGAFAANTVNIAGSAAIPPDPGNFTLSVDGLQIYDEAPKPGGTVTAAELDGALNAFLSTGLGAGIYSKTGSFVTGDLVLSKAGMVSNMTLTSNFAATGTPPGTPGAFSGSLTGVTALPGGIEMKVDLSGGASISVGDKFVARPTYSAAQKIGLNIDDPRKLAAATNVEVDPITNLPVFPASIIKGPMPGDNRNALILANLENKLSMLGGRGTFNDTYGQIISGVGTLTRSAELATTAQETLLNQAKGNRENLAGVNLDEEAANLIRFQQAYQASAQSISVVKSLFDTLIGAVR